MQPFTFWPAATDPLVRGNGQHRLQQVELGDHEAAFARDPVTPILDRLPLVSPRLPGP